MGASWEVLMSDKQLMLFPLLSFFASVLVLGSFVAGAVGGGLALNAEAVGPVHYILSAAFYFCTYFVTIFFNAAMIGAAMKRLNGEHATLGDGLRIALSKLDKIVLWALIAASVGFVLKTLQERAGLLGRILIAILGAAWGAITYFVIPVLVFEPLGVVPSIKRSANIFKERWGEQFIGNAGIGLMVTLFAFLGLLVAGALGVVLQSPVAAIAVAVATITVAAAFGSALSGVYMAAVYRFATTGEATAHFSGDDLGAAFRPRKGK